jgi:hypothetical protein
VQLSGSSSFVKSSVKAVIRALSSSRFPTPIPSGQKRDADSASDARKSDRDLFAEESRLGNRNEGSSSASVEGGFSSRYESELDPEALPIFSGRAIGENGEGFATLGDQGTIRSSIGKLRSVFGPDIRNSFSEPEIRFPLDASAGLPFVSAQPQTTPPPFHGGHSGEDRKRADGWGNLPNTLNDGGSLPLAHECFSTFHQREPRLGEMGASEMGHSVRFGREDQRNVTHRDSKRPKERSRDRAYKTRFSMDSLSSRPTSKGAGPPPLGGHSWPREDQFSPPSRQEVAMTFGVPRSSSSQSHGARNTTPPVPMQVPGSFSSLKTQDSSFEISLIFEGTVVSCRAWETMSVMQLMHEAGRIFGIDPHEIILVLFGSIPASLRRDGYLFGPPRVDPGSRVMVFHTPRPSYPPTYPMHYPRAQVAEPRVAPPEVVIPALNSKLLSTFKLPKFDGVARSWKLWEKSFQRFLSLHQLDYVLEEDFPEVLWTTPGAKAANKMVFFLIEDAVTAGTLASKLVRQATKWNGHEAFVLLRNGYVFNGPQTATILLAELSKIRLLRDEDASSFCLRLIELIEDLELVPGSAAVILTDTQKLGYLLSAIRHETGLQAVYSQLQSEQLRGTITFEQACRELHHRVESMKADGLIDGRSGRTLISTELKKQGQGAIVVEKVSCLAKDCAEMIQPYLPLCKLCYLQSMAGKVSVLPLRDNLGNAIFNSATKRLDFPAGVPKSRFPQKDLKKGRKV